jgi:lysophospholipase L1-like esterase
MNATHEEGSGLATPAGRAVPPPRRWRRRLWVAHLILVHAVVLTFLFVPDAVDRIQRVTQQDPSRSAYYRGHVDAHLAAANAMPGGAVVFLGDSRMWRAHVSDMVASAEPVVNLSIGGDTTRGLLNRMGRYAHFDRASRFVVGTGVNDLSHFDDDTIVSYYEKVLSSLASFGKRITLVAIYPINEGRYTQANSTWVSGFKTTNKRLRAVNERLRQLSQQFPRTDYIDANQAVSDPDGNLRAAFSEDGLHLNAAGNTAWVAALRPLFSGT